MENKNLKRKKAEAWKYARIKIEEATSREEYQRSMKRIKDGVN